MTASIPNSLIRLWHHHSRRRQRQFGFLIGLMLVSAFAEVVSLGAVLPFLGIIIAPEPVLNHFIVADMSLAWGITSADQLVFPLTVAFATAALMAGAIRILLLWVSTLIGVASGSDISIGVYRRILYQPYPLHLASSSSKVISSITNKVNGVVFYVLLPFLRLVSSTILLVAIMLALIAIDPIVATVSAVSFGASYALMIWLSRQRLHINSQHIAREEVQVVKALQEGLGGIRDVLLANTQQFYCNIYSKANRPLRLAQGNNIFIAQAPRYVMETLGMILIAALAYFLSRQAGGIAVALPVLGALALAAQRLLPAMQQVFSAWASIAGSHALLADVIELLDQPLPEEVLQPESAPLLFQNDIQFRDVFFRYTEGAPWVLDGLSLVIAKGARVGFVGSTGSGKSTTLDLLMGLLMPNKGRIMVDGQHLIGNRVRAWQQRITHVPQNIYLADTTLAHNIAFGVPPESIDFERVQQAARRAQIADFIECIPEGYQANVGERGIRLSGGQRQRIGIARALYKQASVLVLDEATSALDNVTEQSVMNTIEGLGSELTILIIAHRLTTLMHCDTIIELEHGKLVAQGTYEQLVESSASFRKMARII